MTGANSPTAPTTTTYLSLNVPFDKPDLAGTPDYRFSGFISARTAAASVGAPGSVGAISADNNPNQQPLGIKSWTLWAQWITWLLWLLNPVLLPQATLSK
jgi:hypothetical protein